MAKNEVLKALEVLAASGIVLTDEQAESLAEFKSSAMTSAAVEIFGRKVEVPRQDGESDEDYDARKSGELETWATDMFALAARIRSEITGDKVGRGRGEVFERMFRIETPDGSLKVSLTESTE